MVACATPKTVHSVVDIQGHRCEMTHVTLDSRNLKDSNFTYTCNPPLPPGMILTGQGLIIPNPVAALQMGVMANAPFNPPDQVCQMQEFVSSDGNYASAPVCAPAATTRDMVVQPIQTR
jgi:hypothetical protein